MPYGHNFVMPDHFVLVKFKTNSFCFTEVNERRIFVFSNTVTRKIVSGCCTVTFIYNKI